MTTKEENYQKDRQIRAQYLNDMRKQHRAIRDIFGGIVQWQHKANEYTFPDSEAWDYWRVTRTAPPPF